MWQKIKIFHFHPYTLIFIFQILFLAWLHIDIFIGQRVLIKNSLMYARCFNYVEFHQDILNLASLFQKLVLLFAIQRKNGFLFSLLGCVLPYEIIKSKMEYLLPSYSTFPFYNLSYIFTDVHTSIYHITLIFVCFFCKHKMT